MDSRLNRFLAVAANTFRETVRERALYNLVLFAILMTLSGLLMKELSIRQDEKIVKDIGLAAMELFGIVIAVLMGAGLVSKEVERRSLHPLLAKPLSRGEFFLGKFTGLAFTILVNLAAMTFGLFVTLWITGHGFDVELLKAIVPLYVSLLLIVALTLFFSTITSTILAVVFTMCLLIAGRYSDIIRNMQEVLPGAPGWITRALYFALPNFANFDFKSRVAHGDLVPWTDVGVVVLYGLAYLLLALAAGLALFRRKEFQ